MALSPDLLAYVAVGGSPDDLCGNAGEHDGVQGQKYEACLLVCAGIFPRSCHGMPVLISDQVRKLSCGAKLLH